MHLRSTSVCTILFRIILIGLALLLTACVLATAQDASSITFKGTPYRIFLLDLSKADLKMHWKDDEGRRFSSLKRLSEWAAENSKELFFATNAGIFDKKRRPLGLHIEDGKELIALNTEEGEGNFYLKPNGVFFISDRGASISSTKDFKPDPSILSATQSGPILLSGGSVHPAFREGSKNRLVRSGVGVISSDRVVFVIAEAPVNFFDFAQLFKRKFNCRDALYLDGVISRFFLAEDGAEKGTDSANTAQDFAGLIAVYAKE